MQLRLSFLHLFAFSALFLVVSSFHEKTTPPGIPAADFVGTWVGRTIDGEFMLVLQEKKGVPMMGGIHDFLIGGCSYVVNGKSVNNSLPVSATNFVLNGMPAYEDKPGTIGMIFRDNINNKRASVTLTLTPGNSRNLQWVIEEQLERITINSPHKWVAGYSVPTNIVLSKVN